MTEARARWADWHKALLSGGAIVLLVFALAAIKGHRILHHPEFSRADSACWFWTEEGIHFRYARWIAAGGEIPAVDPAVQYPEGIAPRERLGLFMEPLAGWMYRFGPFRTLPFHVFLILFLSLYTSISIVPAWFLGRELCGGRRLGGVLAALLHTGCLGAQASSLSGAYVKEGFALPWIYLAVWAWVRMTRIPPSNDKTLPRTDWGEAVSFGALAGAFWFVAFASWHLTQFFYLSLLPVVGVYLLWNPDPADAERARLVRGFATSLLGFAAAGLLIPTMRLGGLLHSPAFVVSLALLATCLVAFRFRWRFFKAVCAWILLGGMALAVLRMAGDKTATAEYSHVYALIAGKLTELRTRHLPEDPTVLPYEIKVMWTSSFRSPSWRMQWDLFGFAGGLYWAGLVALAWVAWSRRLRNRREGSGGRQAGEANVVVPLGWGHALLFSGTLLYAILFLLIVRMGPFLGFWGPLLLAWLLVDFPRGVPAVPARRRWIFALAAAMALFLVVQGGWKIATVRLLKGRPQPAYLLTLTKYIRNNLAPDAVIAAAFPLSPALLCDTGRAIVVHSKFEWEATREKVRRYEFALYRSEEDYWRWCRSVGATHVVQQTSFAVNDSDEGERYRTSTTILPEECAAAILHFTPERARYFDLLFSNPIYRVYRVRPDIRPATESHPLVPYHPHWSRTTYPPEIFRRLSPVDASAL